MLSEVQAGEWRDVNAELTRKLSLLLSEANGRNLVRDVCLLRDRHLHDFEESQRELNRQQASLITASENGDYVRAATIAAELVSLKAKAQAAQAAHHELNSVIKASRVTEPPIRLEAHDEIMPRKSVALVSQSVLEESPHEGKWHESEEEEVAMAKVIPLRRRRVAL